MQTIFIMVRGFKYLLCIVLSALSLLSCINEDNPQEKELKIGDRLPSFVVTMNDGSTLSSEWLSQSISCVVFFHTSCPDCQKTLPEVQKIFDEYSQKGVRFALISREESEESISEFWTEKGFTMPYSAQPSREVYNKFAQTRVPRVYISDNKGKIKVIHTDDPIPTYDILKTNLDGVFDICKE